MQCSRRLSSSSRASIIDLSSFLWVNDLLTRTLVPSSHSNAHFDCRSYCLSDFLLLVRLLCLLIRQQSSGGELCDKLTKTDVIRG